MEKSVLMTSHDIQLSLIPTIFRILICVSVVGPLVVITAYIHHSFIEMAFNSKNVINKFKQL